MITFVVYTSRQGDPPESVFAFHAGSTGEALTMKGRWARNHGMQPSEFGVEENPLFRESGVSVHDEYVDHYGRGYWSLGFWKHRIPSDEHPTLVECHVVRTRPSKITLRALLDEVAGQQFDGRPYKVWTGMQNSSRDAKPMHGLAAEDLSDGAFVVPVIKKRTL